VNEYVLTGKGDPKALLRGMYFWTWDTQEVLDMILWMRQFNQSGKGRIQFLGFDMQFGQVAMSNVRDFVARADPGYAGDLEKAYSGLGDYWRTMQRAKAARDLPAAEKELRANRTMEVVKHLVASRADYVKKAAVDEVDRAIQDARVLAQAVQSQTSPGGSGLYRDQCMAENVAWILDHAPRGSRIVLWAHNGHVGKRPGSMGFHLAKRYGPEMVVLGFACHEGRYTAVRQGRGLVDDNELQAPAAGCLEHYLHETGLPRLILDLLKAARDAPESSWAHRPLNLRSVGALAMQTQFFPLVISDAYDALIYFDKTGASACFRVKGR
jgi:erythromycin esterase